MRKIMEHVIINKRWNQDEVMRFSHQTTDHACRTRLGQCVVLWPRLLLADVFQLLVPIFVYHGYFIDTNIFNQILMHLKNTILLQSFMCSGDRIEISYSGDANLADATRYCTSQPFTRSSVSNKITIGMSLILNLK